MIKKHFRFLSVVLISLGLLSGCGSVPEGGPDSAQAAGDQANTAAADDGRALGRHDTSSSTLDGRNKQNDMSGRAGGEPEHRIYFDYNSSLITGQAAEVLSQNARWIGKRNLTIEGHCDERGTREYNLALGQKRADAAKQYLISQGMDASRIKTVSYGKERPLVNGHSESAWGKNRRAEIIP
ncbi:MAG: peptidoglycan-associated lipoprotein Pal [Magnetococcus sp. YQC-5]